jgi:hypothetical protein
VASVAIVGAGPVGMTAAALLAARDVDVIVFEARETTSADPKAISIDDESLRTYADAGIDGEILRIVSPGTGTKYFGRRGQPLFHARGPVPYRLGYPFKNPFAQPDLERALAGVLRSNPRVSVRFGTRVAGVASGDEGVRLSLAGGEVFTVRYVIGADGGRSTVRESMGIPGWSSLGSLGNGTLVQMNWTQTAGLPDTAEIVAKYGSKYPNANDLGSVALGYAEASVLLNAISRAGSAAPPAINKALASTSMSTALGPVKFTSNKSVTPTFLGQWENGAISQVWPAKGAVSLSPLSGLG